MTYIRKNNRKYYELRKIDIESNYVSHAEGSCLVNFGNTKVICTASVDNRIPPFLRNTNSGWITAEYGMLPRSTHSRVDRESVRGKQSGRTMEIQRMIGRALRAVTDLKKLNEKQIKIDCDVINADGGTRTAAITGAWVALYVACEHLIRKGDIQMMPIKDQISAISCGILNDNVLLDLDYEEDSRAETDANFVLSSSNKIIEIQGTAEKKPFSDKQLFELLKLAKNGCEKIFTIQKFIIDNYNE